MKEQFQKPGVRKWAGQDLVDLQHEPLAAITAFYEEYGSCVIKGCDVIPTGNTYTVTSGMVALEGTDQNGQPTFKVAPFAGVEGVTLPIYLTLTYSTLERPYADLKVKPIAYDFRAAATGVKPTDKPYLEVGVAGGKSFVDAIQDAKHRFFTDTERNKLTGIDANANNYVHPAKHPASMIEQDDQNRMVSTSKMGEWDAKATTAYVAQQIAALVASSPAALDTLNELAAALGNDPNFATTVMNALAGKAGINHDHLWESIGNRPTKLSQLTNDLGNYGSFLTAITQAMVVTALGYTPYNMEDPAGFIRSLRGGKANLVGNWSGNDYWGIGSLNGNPEVVIFQSDRDGNPLAREITLRLGLSGPLVATTSYVTQKIAELVASSPAALDTLNELAAALGNDPNFATTVMNALAGKASTGHTHNEYNHKSYGTGEYLGATYISEGLEKPDYFKAGTLQLQMLNGTNIGATDNWCDVLWMSSYNGPDVKGSNALIFSKYSDRVGFARQDYDSKNWGVYREIFHTGNFALLAAQLENCFPSGAFSADGSKKEHFLDVICAGSVTQIGGRKDYWGVNGGNTYGFDIGKISTGVYRITHSSSLSYYGVVVTCRNVDSSDEKDNYATVLDRNTSYFEVNTFNGSGSRQDSAFDFIMYRLR